MNVWENQIPNEIVDSNTNDTKSTPTLDYYPATKEQDSKTAIVICPGGGYGMLATNHEGKMIAEWFNQMGISAFVLKYRLPSDKTMIDKSVGPLQDAQEAIRIVRRGAEKWKIDPNKIGIIGFSAGGHLASTASTHFNEKVYESDTISARPDFSLLIYPVISMDTIITHRGSRNNLIGKSPSDEMVNHFSNEKQVNTTTPPAFLVHSIDDRTVPVENSINYALALKRFKRPCELHIYQSGGHGYGLGRSTNTESTWPEACKKWLQRNKFLQ